MMTVPLAETIHTAMDGFIHYLAYCILRHHVNVCINALPLQRQEVWHAVDSLQDFHRAGRRHSAAITAIHGIR